MVKKGRQLPRSSKAEQRKSEQMSEQRQGKVSPITVQVQSQFILDRVRLANEVTDVFAQLQKFFIEQEVKGVMGPIPDEILVALDKYYSVAWNYSSGSLANFVFWGFVAGSRANLTKSEAYKHDDPPRGLVWA
jgi:hypothetical protein